MIFNYQDKQVYYEIQGKGEPFIMLNGIMMSTKSWEPFVNVFSMQHQLIRIDFLDQGKSSKCENEQYTHLRQIEMVEAFVREMGFESINLFGVSYGGEIAIQLAIRNPKLIKKLLLFNTCAETTYWLEEVGNAWNAATHDGLAYYLTTIPFIYSPKFFVENATWIKQRKKALIPVFNDQSFIQSMIRLTNSSIGYQAMDMLSQIKAQTLIVGCEYDFITPYYQQEDLHDLIDRSEIVFVPDCGHALFYEKPSMFTSLVLGFLSTTKSDYSL